MVKDITQQHLVLLAYNEIPPKEANTLRNLIAQDDALSSEYKAIVEEKEMLSGLTLQSPHPTSVQIILEESCSSSSMEMI